MAMCHTTHCHILLSHAFGRLANKEGIGTCRVEWGQRIAAVVEKSDRAALSENWPKCRFSGGSRPVRSPAESRPYDVSIKFIRQGLLFLRKTFYLVTNFDAFGKEGAFFLSAEIIDLKASINYIITCKACPKLVSGLNH